MSFENFPYSNFHDLNLDWIINEWKKTYNGFLTYEEAFKSLKDFVENYFKNLDVQSEINNKLDEMAKDGSLWDLLGVYAIRVYDTFDSAVKNIPNITYQVLGRHKINDGGSGIWKTSLVEPLDNYYEKIGNVYHIPISLPMNIVTIGLVDEDGNIDVDRLNSLAKVKNGLFIPSGYYKANKTISTFFSMYSTPISLPNISHSSGDIGSWRLRSNAVIETSADIGIQVNDSCVLENIIVVGNSYKQTENRELCRKGNNQPIYGITETETQIGIYLHDYGSRAKGCAVYYCHTGIKCDYYAKISDCIVFQCKIGIYLLANDNNVIDSRVYDCNTAFYITGVLNEIVNVRCDGISGKGMVIQGTGNNIVNYICDFSYKCALHIKGNRNVISDIRFRCCAQYPNTTTAITDENADGNCGILIDGRGNYIKDIPSIRPSIMDSGDDVYSMSVFVALISGSTFTKAIFNPIGSTTTPLTELITCVSGNAPATIFENIYRYYSDSFTKADDVNVLITNNYANTKQASAPKGTLHFDGSTWFVFNGTTWTNL